MAGLRLTDALLVMGRDMFAKIDSEYRLFCECSTSTH